MNFFDWIEKVKEEEKKKKWVKKCANPTFLDYSYNYTSHPRVISNQVRSNLHEFNQIFYAPNWTFLTELKRLYRVFLTLICITYNGSVVWSNGFLLLHFFYFYFFWPFRQRRVWALILVGSWMSAPFKLCLQFNLINDLPLKWVLTLDA